MTLLRHLKTRAAALILLIVCLSIALVASAASLLLVRRQTHALTARLQEVESKHEEFLEQANYARAIQRKVEAQLLDKQQRLDRLAHHDQLTGLPNRHFLAVQLALGFGAAAPSFLASAPGRSPWRKPARRERRSRCCSSISIVSSTSTTRTVMRSAT